MTNEQSHSETGAPAATLKAVASLTSHTDEYIDVDVYVKQDNGSEFLQRMYVDLNQPDVLIRDEIRFSVSEHSDFDEGGVVLCPPEVMAAFDGAVSEVKGMIQQANPAMASLPAVPTHRE